MKVVRALVGGLEIAAGIVMVWTGIIAIFLMVALKSIDWMLIVSFAAGAVFILVRKYYITSRETGTVKSDQHALAVMAILFAVSLLVMRFETDLWKECIIALVLGGGLLLQRMQARGSN